MRIGFGEGIGEIMLWIQIVLYIIMHLPELITVIKKVIELIHNMPKPQAGAVKLMLSDAIQHHKETKDSSKVKNVCLGIGCSPELVG